MENRGTVQISILFLMYQNEIEIQQDSDSLICSIRKVDLQNNSSIH